MVSFGPIIQPARELPSVRFPALPILDYINRARPFKLPYGPVNPEPDIPDRPINAALEGQQIPLAFA